jgi:hypothetical protein
MGRPKNSTNKPKQPNPNKAAEELSKLDQELFPEGYPENPLVKPTEALQEESPVVNTDVTTNAEIAVNEAEEVIEGVSDKTLEELEDEAGGILAVSPEIMELMEESNQTILEAVVLSEEQLGKLLESVDKSGESAEKLVEAFHENAEKWENREIGAQEEFVGVVTQELTILDGQNKPVPAKEILLGFNKDKASYHLDTMVGEILYIASLGGDWNRKFYPRLKGLPYQVKMIIPEKNYQKYVDREDTFSYDENVEYKKVNVSAIDIKTFMDQLVKFGKLGCMIAPRKTVTKNPRFNCPIITRTPVEAGAFVRVSPNKIIYTREEMKDFTLEQLRIIGNNYGLSGRGKEDLIRGILREQGE